MKNIENNELISLLINLWIKLLECLMLLFYLFGSPLHSIQSYVFWHPLIVFSPSLHQVLEIAHVLSCQLSWFFILRRTVNHSFKFIKSDALCLYFGNMFFWLLLGNRLRNKFINIGNRITYMFVGSPSLDKWLFMTGFDSFVICFLFLPHQQ